MAPINVATEITEKMENWNVRASDFSKNTFNPIRDILENLQVRPNPAKKMISLSIGDPTVFGNLKPHAIVVEATKKALESYEYNGYGPSVGFKESRRAVAEYRSVPGAEITENEVILCSGCSGALDICIGVLADRGQNYLVPRPGFPLYKTLALAYGIDIREYDCLPDKGWEVDLKHMESLIDDKTAAIIVNNPSNPCGSVYSKKHLLEILKIAEKRRVPIIADEIYEHFVFPGHEYHAMASLTKTVPILSCGGLTKRFLIPGWRMGWITVHDRDGIFANGGILSGLTRMTQRIIGSNTVVQGAIPEILRDIPSSYHRDTIDVIRSNCDLAYGKLKSIPGLKPVVPSGAMYMMVGVEMSFFSSEFQTDLQFVEKLIEEQSVFPLPGKCFGIPNFFRIVLTVPAEMLSEACDRIEEFCLSHGKLPMAPLTKNLMSMSMDSSTSLYSASSPSSEDDESDEAEINVNERYNVKNASWISGNRNNSKRIYTP